MIFSGLTACRWVVVCVVITAGAVENWCDEVEAVDVDAVVDDDVVVTRNTQFDAKFQWKNV